MDMVNLLILNSNKNANKISNSQVVNEVTKAHLYFPLEKLS
jgi:hypothetical protein